MLKDIETKNLVIRPFNLGDVGKVYELSREPQLGQWIPDQVYRDESEASDVLKVLISKYKAIPDPRKEPLVLAIVLRDSGELIGHVGLSPCDEGVEIGYAISETHCRKGYASSAVSAFSRWALETLDVAKIYGIVAYENIGSLKVLEKSGYILEEETDRQYIGKIRLCRKYALSQ